MATELDPKSQGGGHTASIHLRQQQGQGPWNGNDWSAPGEVVWNKAGRGRQEQNYGEMCGLRIVGSHVGILSQKLMLSSYLS